MSDFENVEARVTHKAQDPEDELFIVPELGLRIDPAKDVLWAGNVERPLVKDGKAANPKLVRLLRNIARRPNVSSDHLTICEWTDYLNGDRAEIEKAQETNEGPYHTAKTYVANVRKMLWETLGCSDSEPCKEFFRYRISFDKDTGTRLTTMARSDEDYSWTAGTILEKAGSRADGPSEGQERPEGPSADDCRSNAGSPFTLSLLHDAMVDGSRFARWAGLPSWHALAPYPDSDLAAEGTFLELLLSPDCVGELRARGVPIDALAAGDCDAPALGECHRLFGTKLYRERALAASGRLTKRLGIAYGDVQTVAGFAFAGDEGSVHRFVLRTYDDPGKGMLYLALFAMFGKSGNERILEALGATALPY